MDAKVFYRAIGNRSVGPYSTMDIRKMIRNGDILAETLLCNTALDNKWAVASEYSCLGAVHLHVYNMTPYLNTLYDVVADAGVYHGSVEIYKQEWTFGGDGKTKETGVHRALNRGTPGGDTREFVGVHYERIFQGFTELTEEQVGSTIRGMEKEWLQVDYHLLSRNCVHFSNAFLQRLGVDEAPKWVNRAANEGCTKAGAMFAGRVGVGLATTGILCPAGAFSIAGDLVGSRTGAAVGEALGDRETGKAVGGFAGAVGVGAAAGSFIPVVGTAAGAGIGLLGWGIGRTIEAFT